MGAFRMPSLGADMEQGTLVEWRVAPGDHVRRGDIVAVIDTEKSTIEVEVFEDGVIDELLAQPGDEVPVGTVLATIRPDGVGGTPAHEPTAGPTTEPAVEPAVEPAAERAAERTPVAAVATAGPAAVATGPNAPVWSPLVRHRAIELGVDLASVRGTGAGGTITRADVERAAAPPRVRATPRARHLAAAAGVDLRSVTGSGAGHEVYARDLPVATRPSRAADLSARRRAAVATLMARSKREIPHYYLATTIDLHAASAWLTRTNEARDVHDRLIPAALVLRATALAAAGAPRLNGFWLDGGFVPADGVHLGVAISLRGGGLLAPCIRDADQLDLDATMRRLRELVAGARSGVLPGSAMTDPSLTVTNIGEQGVETIYGVIYPPQVALVGVGAIVERPWAVDGMLAVHPVVRISLAADHRASDGHEGARFLAAIDRLLQHPDEL